MKTNNQETPFNEKDINWDELAAIGIIRKDLESSGNLETLLKGEKTEVNVMHIMQGAILANAKHIILVHNHPSGNCSPNRKDDSATRAIINACGLFNIQVIDHLIVSPYSYYSYADNGHIIQITNSL